jgi:hypothetical protein
VDRVEVRQLPTVPHRAVFAVDEAAQKSYRVAFHEEKRIPLLRPVVHANDLAEAGAVVSDGAPTRAAKEVQ